MTWTRIASLFQKIQRIELRFTGSLDISLSSDRHLSELRRMIISEQYFIPDSGHGRGSVTTEWGTVTIA